VNTLPVGLEGLQRIMALGLCLKSFSQFIRIEGKKGRPQFNIDWCALLRNGIRPIIFIKGRKNDDLVHRIADRQHGCHHCFGTATGYDDIFIFVIGSPMKRETFLARACLKFGAPHVTETHTGCGTKFRCFSKAPQAVRGGGSKSGNPCDRLMAPYILATRVIRRMTDSVNRVVRSLT